MLTSAHLFFQYDGARTLPKPLEIKDGHLYLNRNGQNQYNCRFELDMKSVSIFGGYDEVFPSVNGGDFAVVVVKMAYNKIEPQANFEELITHSYDDIKDHNLQVAGYPTRVLGNPERYFVFSD
jgi:hypothetical protein